MNYLELADLADEIEQSDGIALMLTGGAKQIGIRRTALVVATLRSAASRSPDRTFRHHANETLEEQIFLLKHSAPESQLPKFDYCCHGTERRDCEQCSRALVSPSPAPGDGIKAECTCDYVERKFCKVHGIPADASGAGGWRDQLELANKRIAELEAKLTKPTTAEEIAHIRQRYSYDPDTGILTRTWGEASNAKLGPITKTNGSGYVVCRIDKEKQSVHRVAWLLSYGRWPVGQIDHINGIKTDNRLCNLREVSQSENQWNGGKRRDNISGYKGVTALRNGKFAAQIKQHRERFYLGTFDTALEAYEVYCAEAKRRFGNFAPEAVRSAALPDQRAFDRSGEGS